MTTLNDWLATVLPGPAPHIQPLAGGYRNTTLLLTRDNQRWVVRRHRHGNRAAVEVAIAQRVAGIVPVPAVLAADLDGSASGIPTLLLDYIDGRPPHHACADAGRKLAAIGTVTFDHPGTFDRPGAPDTPDLVPSPDGMPGSLPEFVAECMRSPHVRLTTPERDALIRLAERWSPLIPRDAAHLVHSDYNPKNLLVRNATVVAVLDWEFAYSGSPLADVGNMLRFAEEPEHTEFLRGYREIAELPDDWRAISKALDLFALAELLTREETNPVTEAVTGLVRKMIS
ncbi:phosphotransferase family protein [Labedaea rhizosphaerae]|uniref:Aminoglycoside phosphotransferase (APT) family kinase protein n=1 Tax=Labedaea rhizosphaerae TaxID=598644 RepID=A0A4V3CZF9_LABRH|nr:aminoglycoside phosphotransferase family protein [Labedaea rhizosphaerae]TDP97868.1 aminoglycoside phosphotransferase (APT) family kinase protein [Labedaea rhizosphaerae]